jgi:hypothetical protein
MAYATNLDDLSPTLGKSPTLSNVCKKDVKLKWTDVEKLVFSQLKDLLYTAPVLAYPDFNERFFLVTDASSTGLGAMIYQLQDDIARPVSFISHAFNTTEVNWSIPEIENFALIYAMDNFKPFLFGPQFPWNTDAKCLTWLHRVKDTSPKLLHWCLQIQGIDFTIHHKAGRENVVADALSRVIHGFALDHTRDKSHIYGTNTLAPLLDLVVEPLIPYADSSDDVAFPYNAKQNSSEDRPGKPPTSTP